MTMTNLRQISTIKKYLSRDALQKLVSAKILSRIDYCNSLYYGITDDQSKRLSRIQNAAARLILGKKKRDHITPLLRHLHWLPIKARTEYKVASLAFQLFDGTLPPSLSKTRRRMVYVVYVHQMRD